MQGLKKIRVAVKDDKIVLRDPVTKERIATKGKMVPKNGFWLRRLKAGDVIELKDGSAPKPAPKPSEKENTKK